MPLLLLFDIDLTLISTAGAGMEALTRAGRDLHGPHFTSTGIEFAGRLDPVIISDLLVLNGAAPTPAAAVAMRDGYARHLAAMLPTWHTRRALPGVHELLMALTSRQDVTMGLLTGNFQRTGEMKLRACGVDPGFFSVAAWGDESPHSPALREHLVPIAQSRWPGVGAARRRDTVVIGDTPHDVACARAHGARCLAVATGHSPLDQLAAAGADRAVPDLSDTQDVLKWLVSPGA